MLSSDNATIHVKHFVLKHYMKYDKWMSAYQGY